MTTDTRPAPIPTYQLGHLAAPTGRQELGIFFSHAPPDGARPGVRIDRPYRSAYYKIGLCLGGRARLHVGLDAYEVEPGCLVLTPPHVIKQWPEISADYASVDVFFTKAAVATEGFDPDRLPMFADGGQPVVPLAAGQHEMLTASLRTLQAKYAAGGAYHAEMLTHGLRALLYEVAAAVAARPADGRAVPTRGSLLAARFKQLVQAHYATERSLDFYAARLCVTPKHLTEAVKATTGRTASTWITEAVVLEAKVLLHQPAVSIGEVADQLHFADQSAFGRFFRNSTGLSPTAYRQRG